MSDFNLIRGAGGGGGGGGSEASDTVRGTQTFDVIDLISEGECEGLVNGFQSIYLDGVPLMAADGVTLNFDNVRIQTTPGTQGQAAIEGVNGVQNEIGVGVNVVFATPLVRSITNPAIDTCRVTIIVPQLSKADPETGDLGGSSFEWSIEVQSAGGGYVQVFREKIAEKTMSRYPRAALFKLAGAAPWDVKVRRLSADSTSANEVNAFAWSTYTEIQTVKLRYPNSCLVRSRGNAAQFARVPVRSFDWLGMRIQVPSNYDPKTRVYTGVWNGTFKIAWTDNPAWQYHDMVVNNRYGLGRYIETTDAFKWELYAIARYCDELVPDGYGGMEPRFRASPGFETREQAYKVLTDMAAIFRGIVFWLNQDVSLAQDAPGDSVAPYAPANVMGEPGKKFSYTGSSNGKRYSSVIVWFNDLTQQGKLIPEVVIDPVLEAEIGVKPLELSPMGVWSRGQAHRIGQWVLYTQERETEAVTFKVGMDGVLVQPGKLFQIADPHEAGDRMAGRISAATNAQVTLDADVTLEAGLTYTLTVMLQDTTNPTKLVPQQRAVATGAGVTRVLAAAAPFSGVPARETLWLLQSDQIAATMWRCVGLVDTPGENSFTITGIEHQPAKYALIEQGIEFKPPSVSKIALTPPKPNGPLRFTETAYLSGSIAKSRVTVSWIVPALGLSYLLRWRLNSGPWTELPWTSDNAADIDGLAKGFLEASVRSRNALGNVSTELVGGFDLLGWTKRPANVANFKATLVQGGVLFTWNPNQAPNYLATTLRIGSQILFEGAAGSWLWPWPVPGTYTVSATDWDTSLNESLTPATALITVDGAMLVQWASLNGRPKLFRVAARGNNDTQGPIGSGLYDGETNGLLVGSVRSYTLVRIRRSDSAVVFSQYYDVYVNGTDPSNPVGYGRGAAQLAADLNSTGSDHIVVVFSADEPSRYRLTDGLDAAMYRCGASRSVFGSPQFQFRSAYVLVGIAGCGEGNGYESYSGSVSSDTSAWCDVAFTINSGNLLITGSGATPRSLADYSYTGSLDATTDLSLLARGSVVLSGNVATKTSGSNGWGDGDAYSRDSFTGGAFCSGVVAQTNCDLMFGLNADPLSDLSYASLDRAWYLRGDGLLDIYESGNAVAGAVATYAAGDVLAIVYDGSKVIYSQNGVARRSVAAGAAATFFFDSSFWTVGARLKNIRFGPLSAVTAIGTSQLLPGAATEVYVVTPTAPFTVSNGSHTPDGYNWNDQVTSITFTPAASGQAQVYFDGRGTYRNAVSYSVSSGFWSIQNTAAAYDGWKKVESPSIPASGYGSFPMHTTRSFPVIGGTSYTIALYASKNGGGDTFVIDNMELRVEVVKR